MAMATNADSLSQGKRISFGHHSVTNASLLIEKQKATLRRSTPDSEALASSDDEQEIQQRVLSSISARPGRRSSWINETNHGIQRKASLGPSEPKSPSGLPNHPGTPEGNSWSSTSVSVGRVSSVSGSNPWNSTIWNSDTQKGLPSRLTEVLPSPSAHTVSGSFGEESLQSPSRHDSSSEAAIPFAIPLQPTLKSYRSQSYSVGQLDQDPSGNGQFRSTQVPYNGRTRTGSSYSGLQHRPSRPSVLGEFSSDASSLGQLREVDDDEESTASSEANSRFSNTQARRIEQLAMENAILRQRAQMGPSLGMTTSSAPFNSIQGITRASSRGLQISESVLEEPDDDHQLLDDDLIHSQPIVQRQGIERRSSEYAAKLNNQYLAASSDQKYLVNGKKGQWQSSLGFGGPIEPPQSRRHSFADVPLRVSSGGNLDANNMRGVDGALNYSYGDGGQGHVHSDDVQLVSSVQGRGVETYRSLPGAMSPPSNLSIPPQNRLTQFSPPQPHQAHSLYLVTFKAARAEFYYIQEGTGLDVNPGDLVIVEADRGTDLGTVAHKNVEWASARELKEHYVTEHYNWLMMFSRQGQNGQVATQNGWILNTSGDKTSQGHLGLQGVSHSADGINTEIKPKMIKRLAQPHEIHTLREKEGNEAKAKRMCQQKVAEHHLNMEILDAEFQMDWKKLTFYYFADSYINFNSLVTDLFKIYKTRIWMSAINPASFVSPATGPHLPSAIANPTIKTDRHRFNDTPTKHEAHGLNLHTPEPTFDPLWLAQNDRNTVTSSNPYSQYWAGQGFQQLPQALQDYSHSNLPVYRSQTFNTPNSLPSSSMRHQSKTEFKSEDLPSTYADPVHLLQGLTLGPT